MSCSRAPCPPWKPGYRSDKNVCTHAPIVPLPTSQLLGVLVPALPLLLQVTVSRCPAHPGRQGHLHTLNGNERGCRAAKPVGFELRPGPLGKRSGKMSRSRNRRFGPQMQRPASCKSSVPLRAPRPLLLSRGCRVNSLGCVLARKDRRETVGMSSGRFVAISVSGLGRFHS